MANCKGKAVSRHVYNNGKIHTLTVREKPEANIPQLVCNLQEPSIGTNIGASSSGVSPLKGIIITDALQLRE
jgi:hypothetical protein